MVVLMVMMEELNHTDYKHFQQKYYQLDLLSLIKYSEIFTAKYSIEDANLSLCLIFLAISMQVWQSMNL